MLLFIAFHFQYFSDFLPLSALVKVVEDTANAINSPLIISSLVERRVCAQEIECGGGHTAVISFGKGPFSHVILRLSTSCF
jgi:hypothetical protein